MRRRVCAVLATAMLVTAGGSASAEPGGEEPDEDLTPPVLRMIPAAGGVDGWYADTANIDVSATDIHTNATGIFRVSWATSGAQVGSGAFPVRAGTGTLTVSSAGQTTVDVTAADFNANETAGRVVIGIDRTPPTLAMPAGLSGAELVKGSTFPASYSCADADSGVTSCTGTVPVGQLVNTSTVGDHVFGVTARDKVGRVRMATVGYTVVDNVFTWTHAPSIQGTVAVGELLTAQPPTVSPQPTSLSYAWRRNGTLVGTGPTYRVAEADGGAEITVVAAARRDGVTPSDLVSAPRAVPAGTIRLSSDPVLAGEPRVGQTLQLQRGSSLASGTTFTYQWLRDGEVVQSSGSDTYAPTDADIGRVLTARLVATAPGYSTRVWDVGTGLTVLGRRLRVTGTASVGGLSRVGSVLTAQPPGITFPPVERAAAGVTVSYQWLRDGVPVHASTAATYLLGPADFGHRITVLVTGSAPGYESERRTSAPGAPVAAASPVVTAKAKALGRGRVRLTVQAGGIDGLVPSGTVTVRRGTKVVGRGSLRDGALVLNLKKQRPGRVTYTVTYDGAVGIEARTLKVKVKVR